MKRFEKWSVWVTSFLTVATGVGYFVTKYLFTSPDPYSVVGHPWQPYFLKAHILVSPLLLFALGLVAVDHVWSHWVEGVQVSRRTAIATAVSIVPMVVTGYLIQVLTAEGWVRAMAISHIAFGTLYGVGLVLHNWIVRRSGRAGEAGDRGGRGPAAAAVIAAAALLLQGGPPAEASGAQEAPAAEPHRERAGRAVAASPAERTPDRSVRRERTWPAMGTMLHVTARAPDSAAAEGAVGGARDRVLAADSLMSTYRPESEVSRVNRAAGRDRPVRVSPETAAVLREALRWARVTGGAFDPTAGPLARAWGFHEGEPRPPAPAARDSAARLVGWERVEWSAEDRSVRLPEEGMRLDLGAVAKGHALDEAVEAMRARGAEAGMVDLGGNLRVFGSPPGGAPGAGPDGGDGRKGAGRDARPETRSRAWRLGIRHPRRDGGLLGTLSLDSGSVATSGDSEQFFERDGVRYSHIMDPRSGRPARGVAQVTVVAGEASTADALATALFVLGPDRGLEWLRGNDRLGRGRGRLSLALWVRDPEGGPVCPRHVVRAGPMAETVELALGRQCVRPPAGETSRRDGR